MLDKMTKMSVKSFCSHKNPNKASESKQVDFFQVGNILKPYQETFRENDKSGFETGCKKHSESEGIDMKVANRTPKAPSPTFSGTPKSMEGASTKATDFKHCDKNNVCSQIA